MVAQKHLCTLRTTFCYEANFKDFGTGILLFLSRFARSANRSRCRNARDCSHREFLLIFCFLLQFRSHLAGRRGSEGRSFVAVRTNFSEIVSWPTEANRESGRDPGGGPLSCFVYKTIHLPSCRLRRPCCTRFWTS